MMDNLGLFLGNLDPLSWLCNLVMPILLYEGEGGGEGGGGESGGGTATPSAFDALPEDLRGNPSIVKFKEAEGGYVPAVSKAYVELSQKIASKGVLIPGENASKEEIETFHTSLGRPAKAEDYKIPDLPTDGDSRVKIDEATAKGFQELAFKLGLTPTQAQELMAFDLQKQTNAYKLYDEAVTDDKNKSETTLRGEWGGTFPARKELAMRLLNSFAPDQATKDFLLEQVGNSAIGIKFLYGIASKMSEDSLGPLGESRGGKSPQEALVKINQIKANKDHPWHDDQKPLHKEALQEMTALFKLAYPPKVVG